VISRLQIHAAAALLGIAALGCSVATAQTYPTKPIRIVVPFPPGSGPDVVARAIAQKAPDVLKQPVTVENRAGAGGIIAAELVAAAPADGYTLLMGTIGTHALNVVLYKKLPYDPQKDFAPITQLALLPHVVLIHPSVPAKSVRDFVAIAKSKPGQINYASAGIGSGMHLATELMKSMGNIDIVHVPYKGPAESMTAVIAGEVQLTLPAIPATIQLIKSGKVTALAVTSAQRSLLLPDTPTMAEAGFPGFDFSNWSGVFAPAGTPPQIVRKLSEDLNTILRDPEVSKALMAQGAILLGNTPEQFAANISTELVRWRKVAKDANIQAQ
jgi:tripartite-type tricarboxylate transporter receptor subunit TctC